jgi:hypothetical protein
MYRDVGKCTCRNNCSCSGERGVRYPTVLLPILMGVKVSWARANARKMRVPVGRSVVRVGAPSYRPATGAGVCSSPRRTCGARSHISGQHVK